MVGSNVPGCWREFLGILRAKVKWAESIGAMSTVTLKWGLWVPFLSTGGPLRACSLPVSTVRSYTSLGSACPHIDTSHNATGDQWGHAAAPSLGILLPGERLQPCLRALEGGLALPAWPLAMLDHTHHLFPEVISTDGEREYSIFWFSG